MEWRRFVTYLWNDPRTHFFSLEKGQDSSFVKICKSQPLWSAMISIHIEMNNCYQYQIYLAAFSPHRT